MRTTVGAASARTLNGHLVIRHLSKDYAGESAIADVNLEIRPGELIALLGPSGCGKTTLLRCIAGLVSPTGGSILVDGRSIVGLPVYRRDFGMVFQSYALFPHMTVRDNVAFGLKMRGVGKADRARRVDEALDLVQMRPLAGRMPGQLSGGQQQRIALARAIVANPVLLLLDEPFSALDAKLRESLQIEVRQLQRRLGITTIFVTHDQSEALTIADRIAVMNMGVIEQFDSPELSYAAPKTLFVADFIGRMNRIMGRMIGRQDGFSMISLEGQEGIFMARDNEIVAIGDRIVATVRPEKMEVSAPNETRNGYAGIFEGRVSEVIFAGEKLRLFVETKCGQLAVVAPNRQRGDAPSIALDRQVEVGWSASDMMIFPAPR